MNNARTTFRLCVAALGLVVAFAILLSRVGVSIIGCDQGCSDIGNLWFSWIFLLGLFIGNAIYIWFVRQGHEARRFWMGLVLGAAAISAFLTMAAVRTLCPVCIAAQSLWCILAIDALADKSPRLVLAGCILTVGWSVYAIRDSNRGFAEPTSFVLRGYERVLRGGVNGVVIFSDPFCPYCREAERRFDDSKSPLPVLHRWKLLSQNGDRSTRLAAAIESALQTDAVKGAVLRKEILTLADPSDKEQIQRAVEKSAFALEQFENWLSDPEPSSLDLVLRDGELAKKLSLDRVPSLCVVVSNTAGNYPSVRVATKRYMQGLEPALKSDLSIFDVFLGVPQGAKQ